jgi:hypothetical protein
MSISTTLIEKMADYEASTGIKPGAIYLGEHEMALLKKWVYVTFDRTFHVSDGPEFHGVKVFKVYADRHVGIG